MPKAPRPGRPVRGSTTGRPLMALFDQLGRRQALRAICELREVRLTFRALQNACGGVSPTVLNKRLKELRDNQLIDLKEGDGYGLTALGQQLGQALRPLTEWSERWAKLTAAKWAG